MIEDFKSAPKVIFQGQPRATVNLYRSKNQSSILVNNKNVTGTYDNTKKTIKIHLR